jgi:hypothetical protein
MAISGEATRRQVIGGISRTLHASVLLVVLLDVVKVLPENAEPLGVLALVSVDLSELVHVIGELNSDLALSLKAHQARSERAHPKQQAAAHSIDSLSLSLCCS